MILKEDYPNLHDSAIGQAMPDAIGLNELNIDLPGAMEAYCIDVPAFKYLALGSQGTITAVYSDSILQTEGAGNDYTILYADGWKTYVVFNATQDDNKVTFDCEGYSFGPWDSANGYVQNPAYVIGFYLAFLLKIPVNFLDFPSWDILAEEYEDFGFGEAGRLILQTQRNPEEVLKELLFTFKAKMYLTKEGKLALGRKDLTDEAGEDIVFFRQIDVFNVEKRSNLNQAVNIITAKYDHYPTNNIWLGTEEESSEKSIEDYETEMGSDSDLDFPWTDDVLLVQQNISEILDQLAYGDKRINFKIPMNFVNDIDIFDTFRFQDPFGLSLSGEGELYRYYYITKLGYNLLESTIDVEGIDLQYLLSQCFILGDHALLPDNWLLAGPEDRLWGYLCNNATGLFPDGVEGKHLCKMRG